MRCGRSQRRCIRLTHQPVATAPRTFTWYMGFVGSSGVQCSAGSVPGRVLTVAVAP